MYQYKQVDNVVFRAYDIRGVVGTQLDENAFYTIGLAIACYLRKKNRTAIFIGRDARLTSLGFAKALRQGLIESGITLLDLGLITTPILYYATKTQKVDSGLMVTGSHNPAEYNGIKLVVAGKTLLHADIQTIYSFILAEERGYGQGHGLDFAIIPDYCQRIVEEIKLQRPFKVVVDCGNGVAGTIIPDVIRNLGCEVLALYCEVDGRFPHHHPDPSIERNLDDLKRLVRDAKADIGIAFDGDADRLGVVDEKGQVIWPDRLLMYYAIQILKIHPGATIVYDVKCSRDLEKVIHDHGGVAKMCPTGHSIVKAVMNETQALLAGEMSGHLFFKDRWYGFDDALYSSCRLLEMLSRDPRSVSEQFNIIPSSFHTPEIKIPIADEVKFSFMQRFCEEAQFPQGRRILIDGLRVEFNHGWGLLRASNTTPCLVARFEAIDQISLEQIQGLFRTQLTRLNGDLGLTF